MVQNSILVRCLWAASPLVQSFVIAAMWHRRLHREFPWFFRYSLYAAISNAIALCLFLPHRLTGTAMGFAILLQDLGCILLRFAVIYELFILLIRPYPVLRNAAHWLFRLTMATFILGGVALAASHHWTPTASLLFDSVNLGDRTVDLVQCGILLVLLFFSKYMRLSWRDYAMGIAIGLGVYAAVDLSVAAILTDAANLPRQQQTLLSFRMTILSMSTYLFCILIWLAYAFLPEQAPKSVTIVPEHDLDSWNHELERLLQR